MTARRTTGVVLAGIGVLLLALWGYARSDWVHTVRIQLALHGYPFSELRDEAPASRNPDAERFGLAYRRSVYVHGRYVGCVERFGSFIPAGTEFGNPLPVVVVYAIHEWSQYVAGLSLLCGLFLLVASRRSGAVQKGLTGTCPECGKEYPVKTLRLDPGFCPEHRPGFLSKPIWFLPTQAGTKAVWQYVVGMHVFYLLFFPLLLDCGTVSVPGALYSVTVVAHFAIRFLIARRKGFPILTRTQTLGLLLLPFYGLVGFIWLFHSVQILRYGE